MCCRRSPTGTTASISAKELTIADLKVKDKQYDGKNSRRRSTARPRLHGAVDGDALQLLNGVPDLRFRVTVGKGHPGQLHGLRSLRRQRDTLGNYALAAAHRHHGRASSNISADGSEYERQLQRLDQHRLCRHRSPRATAVGLTDTAGGAWADSLTASGRKPHDGTLAFLREEYRKPERSPPAVTEHYKIDKTAPTGGVRLNERIGVPNRSSTTITFGLFFNDDVNVKLTAEDEASGVKSVLYSGPIRCLPTMRFVQSPIGRITATSILRQRIWINSSSMSALRTTPEMSPLSARTERRSIPPHPKSSASRTARPIM